MLVTLIVLKVTLIVLFVTLIVLFVTLIVLLVTLIVLSSYPWIRRGPDRTFRTDSSELTPRIETGRRGPPPGSPEQVAVRNSDPGLNLNYCERHQSKVTL